jgi:isoleucyl-tRNA synthetase
VSRLQGTTREVIERMEAYDCTTAGRAIAGYVDDLSNWYVRLSRRRFWEGDRAAFATLRHCLVEVSKLLAPFTPFLADEIHANLTGEDSVHLSDFPEPDPGLEDGALETGVEAARRAVELGRAARAQAKVKMRQPLRRAVIVATGAEREQIERLGSLVAGELNVKSLDFVSEEGELVRYAVRPNYRSLGPRFGKLMPTAAAAIEALDPDHVAEAIRDERRIGINVDGSEHELGPDDITLVMQPLDGYQVEAEAGRAVALELDLDDELRREGMAREIVHAVQGARRDAGLEVTDRITLSLAGDDELLDAARAHHEYIAGETLATEVAYGELDDGTGARIEGRELRIGVSRS